MVNKDRASVRTPMGECAIRRFHLPCSVQRNTYGSNQNSKLEPHPVSTQKQHGVAANHKKWSVESVPVRRKITRHHWVINFQCSWNEKSVSWSLKSSSFCPKYWQKTMSTGIVFAEQQISPDFQCRDSRYKSPTISGITQDILRHLVLE